MGDNQLSQIFLLEWLREQRKRRILASFITTYAVNLPFYEEVVLRHLERVT